MATRTSKLDIEIEEMTVDAASLLVGKPLREATILRDLGLIVIGIRSAGANGEMLFNPSAATTIQPGDILITMGKHESFGKLRRFLSPTEA